MQQHEVWDSIAPSWDSFKRKPLPLVEKLAQEWKPGKILDIGCGNCRNLLPFAKAGFECWGVDFSRGMIKVARKFCDSNKIKVNLQQAKAERLPFASWDFDYCLSIASLHHVENSEQRKIALFEMRRVLKPGGKALVVVWNKLQWRFLFKPKDYYVKWHIGKKVYHRYYHLFTYWELKKLLGQTEFALLHSSGPFGRNLVFIANKPKKP